MESIAYIHMALAYEEAQQTNVDCGQSETENCQIDRPNADNQPALCIKSLKNSRCNLQIAKA